MSILDAEFARIIDVAGATKETLLRDVQNEIPELLRKWEIDRYEARANLNDSVVNIKSKTFNGAFEIRDGEFSITGSFAFPLGLKKKKFNEAFDTWLSQTFSATPDC